MRGCSGGAAKSTAWPRAARRIRIAIGTAAAARDRDVDLTLLHETLVGADLDLARLTYRNWQELEAYCYRSAGALQTLIAATLAGDATLSEPEREFARRLGSAMRQAEILRDLRRDMPHGRLYAPLEALEAAGIDPAACARRLRRRRHLMHCPATGARGSAQSWPRCLACCSNAEQRRTQRHGLVLAALHERLLARPRAARESRRPRRARAAHSTVDRVAHRRALRDAMTHRPDRHEPIAGDSSLPTAIEPRTYAAPPGLLAGPRHPRDRRERRPRRRAGAGLRRARRHASCCAAATCKKLEGVYDAIVAAGGPRPSIAPLDLERADATHYAALADAVRNEFGRLDGLVHAAALLGERAPIEHYDVVTWLQGHARQRQRRVHPDAGVAAAAAGVAGRIGGVHDQRRVGARARVLGRLRGVEVRRRRTDAGARRRDRHHDATSASTASIRARCARAMRAKAYPGEVAASVPLPEVVLPPFLYLLGPASRGATGHRFEAQLPARGLDPPIDKG